MISSFSINSSVRDTKKNRQTVTSESRCLGLVFVFFPARRGTIHKITQTTPKNQSVFVCSRGSFCQHSDNLRQAPICLGLFVTIQAERLTRSLPLPVLYRVAPRRST